MKYIIWNKTQDTFWGGETEGWSNRYYANKYTIDEIEGMGSKFIGSGDVVLVLISLSI